MTATLALEALSPLCMRFASRCICSLARTYALHSCAASPTAQLFHLPCNIVKCLAWKYDSKQFWLAMPCCVVCWLLISPSLHCRSRFQRQLPCGQHRWLFRGKPAAVTAAGNCRTTAGLAEGTAAACAGRLVGVHDGLRGHAVAAARLDSLLELSADARHIESDTSSLQQYCTALVQ